MKRLSVLLFCVIFCLCLTGCTEEALPVKQLVITKNGTVQMTYLYSYDRNGFPDTEILTYADEQTPGHTDCYIRDEKGNVIAFKRISGNTVTELSVKAVSPYAYDLCDETGAVVRRVVFDRNHHIVLKTEDELTTEWQYDMGKNGLPTGITRQRILPSGQTYLTRYTVTILNATTYTYFDPEEPEILYTASCQ